MSVEATADVVRGLLIVEARLPADQEDDVSLRIAALVAAGTTVLERALDAYETGDAKRLARFARVAQAVAQAEHTYPLGLQRLASMPWPGTDDAAVGMDRALLEHLAAQNKALRAALQEADQHAETERQAARLGRAAATSVGAAVVLAPFLILLVRVGTGSWIGLAANLAVILAVVGTLLTFVFDALSRRGLLATPALKLQKVLKPLSDVLGGVGKIKR